MLADFLNKVRQQAIGEMKQRAGALEGPGPPSAGRSERLNLLFDELIAALRYMAASTSMRPPPPRRSIRGSIWRNAS